MINLTLSLRPGNWWAGSVSINTPDGKQFMQVRHRNEIDTEEAAKRVISCWNAQRGMSQQLLDYLNDPTMPQIRARSTVGEFALENLAAMGSIWLRVDHFDLLIKRDTTGLSVEVYAYKESGDYSQYLAKTKAFNEDVLTEW